jgi:A/G-specific adenine glycosylase
MLQQTRVETVQPYWQRWMKALPDMSALAKAKPQRLHKLWEGLGYYTRVRNMHRAAQLIMREHGGRFPEEFDSVLAMPGIGRYTAGAICSIAFGQAQPILDGNVMRVLTRLFGVSGDPRSKETNAQLWQLATALVQEAAAVSRPLKITTPIKCRNREFLPCSEFNQSFMELGALVCTPRQPRCEICPVAKLCVALSSGRVDELPHLPRRPKSTARRFVAVVASRGGRYLVRQRPDGVVNGHLWEFPNLERASGDSDTSGVATTILGFKDRVSKPFCTIRHSITRYRMILEAIRVNLPPGTKPPLVEGRWLRIAELRKLPFATAHRRILDQL